MKKITLGPNFAVFILFFGVSLLDAFESQNWIRVGFWMAIALFFLGADVFRNGKKSTNP